MQEANQLSQTTAGELGAERLFVHSLNPMLVADDDRRCVDANAAACRLLRRPVEAVRELKFDDVSAPDLRNGLQATWPRVVQGSPGTQTVPWNLHMPDGTGRSVDLYSVPHVRPGRHLAIILFPIARGHVAPLVDRDPRARKLLTKREREVLTLVALGNTGVEIASHLFLSPATVQSHVVNSLIKLNAKNRAHGVALALQRDELDLGTPSG